jgi:hypothetical protein
MFMIRVSGHYVFFYSHKFSEALLDSIADAIEPIDNTQIQKFSALDNDPQEQLGLSLLVADHRAIIFNVLDCIQQIISKM